MIEIALSRPDPEPLWWAQAIPHLGRLRPVPYDVITELMEDSVFGAWSALFYACEPVADSIFRTSRKPRPYDSREFVPYDLRPHCGAFPADPLAAVRGTYVAVMPCGDCDSIRLELALDTAKTFVLRRRYFGIGDTALVEYGTWGGSADAIYLRTDYRRTDYSLMVRDSLTLQPRLTYAFAAEVAAVPPLRRVSVVAEPSSGPCRVGAHRGGIASIHVRGNRVIERVTPFGVPPESSIYFPEIGCVYPLPEDGLLRAGPLPERRYEIKVLVPGEPAFIDTAYVHRGYMTQTVVELPSFPYRDDD